MAEIAVASAIPIVDLFLSYLISVHNQSRTRQDLCSTKCWLNTMLAYLKDTEGREVTEGLKDRVQQVRAVAFDIEDVIDEFMLHVPKHFHDHNITKFLHGVTHSITDKIPIHRLNSSMEDIKAKIKDIKDFDQFRILPSEQASSSRTVEREVPSDFYPNVRDDELVGIEKRTKELLDLIYNRESGQTVISVLGSRGSGKTTLIKEVYEKLKEDFDAHAWISDPHPVNGISDQICAAMDLPVPQGTDAKQMLQSYLQKTRYFLVFDGIWKKDDWNVIQSVLPKGCPGSITIISTQKYDVASYCVNHTYSLNALTWEEGWQLFCKKTFRGNKCPKHLVDTSERILKRCEGLPLAIVAVASLLSNKPHTTSEFEKLHNSLGHELGSNEDLSIMGKILLQSYYHLSHNLKRCFLYFCNFPEDYSVTRGRLVRLWIAEQFVEGGEHVTLEDMANKYLNELLQMNLVYVSRRDLQGRVRSCRVVNLVREFILSKSQKTNFCRVLTRTKASLAEPPRRLSLHNFGNNTLQGKDLSRVRTLMTFGRDSFTESMAGKLLNSFRLLKVLDLEDVALESFPEEVVILTLLRYLSLRNTKIKTIPRSIKKLQSLVTLDLRQTCIKKLPKKILKLHQLLYLFVDWRDLDQAREGAEVPLGIGNLTSLQKLSLVRANKESHRIVREFAKLIELRKLGITELEKQSGMDLCASIQKMEHLSSLYVTSAEKEILDLDYVSKPPNFLCRLYLGGRLLNIPQWISSLQSLVKICLKGSKLKKSPLMAIQALPSLLELRLVDAYTGEELEFEAKWFQKLMILEIEQFDKLRKVLFGREALPELQKLILRRCMKLEASAGIHKLVKLEEILLYDMPEQLSTGLHKTTGKHHSNAHHIPLIRSFSSRISRQ